MGFAQWARERTVRVTAEQFDARRLALFGADVTAAEEDVYLAVACDLDDDAATRLLSDDVRALARQVSRGNDPPDFADEVHQELMRELTTHEPGGAKKLTSYRATGPLKAWLKTCVLRAAQKQRKRRRPEASPSDEPLEDVAQIAIAPDLAAFKAQHRDQFSAIFSEALAALEPRQRNVLRLRYIDQLTVQQIGGLLKVHHSNVVRTLKKCEEWLRATVKRQLARELGLTGPHVESAVDALVSGVHPDVWHALR